MWPLYWWIYLKKNFLIKGYFTKILYLRFLYEIFRRMFHSLYQYLNKVFLFSFKKGINELSSGIRYLLLIYNFIPHVYVNLQIKKKIFSKRKQSLEYITFEKINGPGYLTYNLNKYKSCYFLLWKCSFILKYYWLIVY